MSYPKFYGPSSGGCHQPQPLQWIRCYHGSYPQNAIVGGYDSGASLLVARAYFNGALIPGKLHRGHSSCYVAWNGYEHPVPEYEVLAASPGVVHWVPSFGGHVFPNAVQGGYSESGEFLFVGRAHHAGMITPGKVHPSHGVCYIPYGGVEVGVPHYDVLVHQSINRSCAGKTNKPGCTVS